MIVVVIRGPDGVERRVRLRHDTATIGRRGCDIMLEGGQYSPRHATIDASSGQIVLTDLGTTVATLVAGHRVTTTAIEPGEPITIGEYTLSVMRVADAAVEDELVAAIADGSDPAARLVYADWLEEHGEPARAEFLRLQEANVIDPRLVELAKAIPLGWRFRVARRLIERCGALEVEGCVREWSKFTPTARHDIRDCARCGKHVAYCSTITAARTAKDRGDVVVVDHLVARVAGDLFPIPQVPDHQRARVYGPTDPAKPLPSRIGLRRRDPEDT